MTPSKTFRRALKSRSDRVRLILELVSTDHVRFGVSIVPDLTGVIEARGDRQMSAGGTPLRLAIRELWLPSEEGEPALHTVRYTVLDARTGLELVGYHFHPPSPPIAHFHMGSGAGVLIDAVHRAHFPAPGARLEDIVGMLIRDFRVRPRRVDWESVLAEE